MEIQAYEGVVKYGVVHLPDNVLLEDGTPVHLIVLPELDDRVDQISSPRLRRDSVDQPQAAVIGLNQSYAEIARDKLTQNIAMEWIEAVIEDVADNPRRGLVGERRSSRRRREPEAPAGKHYEQRSACVTER